MTCLRVKHSINDLAGRLSKPRFFAQMLMDEALLRASSINIWAKNLGLLNRPAKSFIECLTK